MLRASEAKRENTRDGEVKTRLDERKNKVRGEKKK